jgi:hypothetical protein
VASLGGALAQWESVFRANAVDGEMFLELTNADMTDDLGTYEPAMRIYPPIHLRFFQASRAVCTAK